MVGDRLGEDLLSFGHEGAGAGRPGAAAAVRGEGFFTRVAPDFMLTEIHRQAGTTRSSACRWMCARASAPRGGYGDSRVIDVRDLGQRAVTGADQVLVGRNVSRRTVNQKVRKIQGRDPRHPEPGDRLVCLKKQQG